ncbi:hypothetical protein ACLKA7_004926 [Drosophila subpalustris]
MSLSKWVSNTPCISNLSDNNNKPAKVLDLHWQPGEDTLSSNACLLTQADSTKRQVLSLVQRIFDPLKQQSLPRLELCGALLLCRLIVAVKDALRGKEVKVHAWCDSTIVLAWLSHQPSDKDKNICGKSHF